MQLHIKLLGMLKEHAPAEPIDWPEGTSIQAVLQRLGISAGDVQICSVNGELVRDPAWQLAEGDELTVLPPVGGG